MKEQLIEINESDFLGVKREDIIDSTLPLRRPSPEPPCERGMMKQLVRKSKAQLKEASHPKHVYKTHSPVAVETHGQTIFQRQ